MAKYQNHLKKNICERILGGEDIKLICDKEGLKKATVKQWLKKYQKASTIFDPVVKTYATIKEELQGNEIIKRVRSIYMGSTAEMAELAREEYELSVGHKITKKDVMEHTDEVLMDLIKTETALFVSKSENLAENIIPIYQAKIYGPDSPYNHMNKLVDSLEQVYKQVESGTIDFGTFIKLVNKHIIPASQHIAMSNSQSAKCRAGASLEHHFSYLLDVCGFPYETQKQIEAGETIADFFLPNEKAVFQNPKMVMNVECQTTLKDRHRLTSGKFTDYPLERFLATGTGCGLFTDSDFKDVSIEKLKELILSNNITLIVFDEVKNNLIDKIQSKIDKVINDEKYTSKIPISDLKTMRTRAPQSVITFNEFFTKRVEPYIALWSSNGLL